MAKQSQLSRNLANLRDLDVTKRIDAAQRLGRYKNREAVHPLIDALSDTEYKVRRNAARSLGMIGDAWAVEPLILALGDETASVRRTAATSLGLIRDDHAVEALCRVLRDKKRTVRENARDALIQIGESAVSGLAQAITNGSVEAQEEAGYALVTLYEKERIVIVSRIFSEPKLTPRERFLALEAIKNARPGGFLARFSSWFGNVSQLCTERVEMHRTAGTTYTAECRGAESVLQYMTLVRAGQRDTKEEGAELLRGSSADNTPQKAGELLRASDFAAENSPPENSSLWKQLLDRLKSWLFRPIL
jgi:HEAT repeat protein